MPIVKVRAKGSECQSFNIALNCVYHKAIVYKQLISLPEYLDDPKQLHCYEQIVSNIEEVALPEFCSFVDLTLTFKVKHV